MTRYGWNHRRLQRMSRGGAALILVLVTLSSQSELRAVAAPAAPADPAVRAASTENASPLPAEGAVVPDEYVLQVAPDTQAQVADQARTLGMEVVSVYTSAYEGLTVKGDAEQVAQSQTVPEVPEVAPNQLVGLADVQQNDRKITYAWNLDRIDQPTAALDSAYHYPASAGSGVWAYVVDTGIAYHPDFGTRVLAGNDFTGTGQPAKADCMGHGTHVAGTIGSTYYGVAKSVTLVPVRVFACNSGTSNTSIVASALDWIMSDPARPASSPVVVNLSLSGENNAVLNDAVQAVVDWGAVVVVAAGNTNNDACQYSPASAPDAITVGATNQTDRRLDPSDWGYDPSTGAAKGSNIGTCVDLFAPGEHITSPWKDGSGYLFMSGTSMASPAAAGVAALLLAGRTDLAPPVNGTKTWAATPASIITAELLTDAVRNVVVNAGAGSPNLLLQTRETNWSTAWNATPWLGAPVAPVNCTLKSSGCAERYANGWLLRTPQQQFLAVPGVVRTLWTALGQESGTLGYPLANPTGVVASGTYQQQFTGGTIAVTAGVASSSAALSPLKQTLKAEVGQSVSSERFTSPLFGSTGAAYSITPALPAGLELSSTSGIISGTPSTIAPTTDYVITASTGGVAVQAFLTLTVAASAPPIGMAYVTASSGVRLSWTPVTRDSGELLTYRVRVSNGSPTQTCTSYASSCSITKLTPGVAYVFELTAENPSDGISATRYIGPVKAR